MPSALDVCVVLLAVLALLGLVRVFVAVGDFRLRRRALSRNVSRPSIRGIESRRRYWAVDSSERRGAA